MADDQYLRKIKRFAEAAARDPKLWQTIPGQSVEHARFGRGIVAGVDPADDQVYLDIVFQDLPEPESRKTFGSVALMNGMISGLDLSSATLPAAPAGETPLGSPGVVGKEPAMIEAPIQSSHVVREYRFDGRILSDWIALSLQDPSTVQWLTHANLPARLHPGIRSHPVRVGLG